MWNFESGLRPTAALRFIFMESCKRSYNVPYGTINPFEYYATINFRVRDFSMARVCNSAGKPAYAK
jgi:hypothetical protein